MKRLAWLPHEYKTWLYHGHSIPNGDPAEPFASSTCLSGMILAVPTLIEDIKGFFTLTMDEGKDVHFFTLVSVYSEELKYKLKHGDNVLLNDLVKTGVNEIVNINRNNVCKKRRLF